MVHEQGEVVGKSSFYFLLLHMKSLVIFFSDSIEANVDSAVLNVDRGGSNIRQAGEYQVRSDGFNIPPHFLSL